MTLRATVLVLLCGLAAGASAQTPADSTRSTPRGRPTVGLVLSGGAARGIAHVGALRVIEAAGVPVDVVAGTSMGAVVGGLYAVGYSVDSLEAVVEGSDWVDLFVDTRDRRGASPEVRLGESAASLSLPIAGGSIGLPSGLIAGQDVFEMLARLTWPVQGVRDFRELPRPFAAVVVDAGTGAAVRLTEGSLPLAIRASLSIPSVFEPVDLDGRVYIDGGLARNLPAEDAQALGADVLVCVDVTEKAPGGARPASFVDVLLNAVFYQADQNLAAQQARCDVLIQPDLDGLTPASFASGTVWIERGAAAAEAQRPALEALAARLGRPGLSPPPAPTARPVRIESVSVRGVTGPAEQLVRRRLALALPRALTAEEINAAVERVYATSAFDLVTYRVAPDSATGAPTLVVDARRAKGNRLGFGFRYDTAYDAALLFSLSLRDVGRFGSVARLDARLGEQTGLQAGYVTRLGIRFPLSVAAQAGYSHVPVPLFGADGTALAGGALDVVSARALGGPVLAGTVLTGIGPSVTHVRLSPDFDSAGFSPASWTLASLAAFATADTRDRRDFASRGARLLSMAEASPGFGARFVHVVADAEADVPVFSTVSLGGRVAAARAWGPDVPADRQSYVGGATVPALLPGRFFPLYGAETLSLAGPAAQVVAASIQWQPLPRVFLRAMANAGRAGASWSLDRRTFRTGGALTLGAVTPVGPIEVTLSGARLDRRPGVFAALGRSF